MNYKLEKKAETCIVAAPRGVGGVWGCGGLTYESCRSRNVFVVDVLAVDVIVAVAVIVFLVSVFVVVVVSVVFVFVVVLVVVPDFRFVSRLHFCRHTGYCCGCCCCDRRCCCYRCC